MFKNGIWTGPREDFSGDYYKLGEEVLENLRKSPDFVGQIDGVTGVKNTFGSMAEKSIRCALWLKKQGVKPGDVVGYCSKNCLDSYVPLFASSFICSIFNPWWDSCLDEDLVKYFVELTEPKVIFVDEESAELISKTIPDINRDVKIVCFVRTDKFESLQNILDQLDPKEVENFECTKVERADTPLAIMYTSGTTGRPKGAIYTYGSTRKILRFEADDGNTRIGIWFSTMCWITGFLSTLRSAILKSTSIIHNSPNEKEACKIIQNYGVTWLVMGTGVANRLYKTKAISKYDLSSVTRGSIGGAVMKKDVEQFIPKLFPRAIFLNAYGCTEFGIVSAGPITAEKPTTVGKITANTELKVIDPETNEILGPNQEGELCFRGPTMMAGYWKDPEATKEAIDSEGFYHSGDLGCYDEDGYIFVIERLKELIKYRLHHVPPAAIERVIQTHPAVSEVGVVAKPHYEDVEQPMAFITICPGAEVTEREIVELVESKMHQRMKLRGGVQFLDKMPYTASGKIAKKELRALANKS